MLVLLPASEAKTPVQSGTPLDPARLSFPTLTTTRSDVLRALIEVCAQPMRHTAFMCGPA